MTSKQKKRIMKLLEAFDWMFGIQNYERIIVIEEEDIGDEFKEACRVTMQHEYMGVELHIRPVFFEHDLDKQRKILLHEFCHLIPVGLQKIAYDLFDGKFRTENEIAYAKERATSEIENLLHKFLTGGGKHYKQAYKEYLEE